MTIGGECVPGKKSFGVINPATGKVFAEAPECSAAQLDAAVSAAGRAFPGWSQDIDRRRQALLACAEAIKTHAEELAPVLTREQGRPLPLAHQELEFANATKVGDGMDPESQLGPVNNKPQFERVIELVEDAKRGGATIVTGGKPLDGDGYFYPPTLVTGVGSGTRLVDEEQFGPALPIISYADVEEAISSANDTTYGLGGSVWSADPERAVAIGDRLESGTVWINTHMMPNPAAPFGGWKWSGPGVENGIWGLTGFTDVQTISVARA